MTEIMSFEEIKNRIDSEWVLLEDPVSDEGFNIKEGKVLCHSKNRDEVYRIARETKPKHSAIFFVGKIPQDTVVVL